MPTTGKVIVFGGSLVGVKTAVHLRQAGFEVSLVVRRGHILLRALSPEAAEVVEAHLPEDGDPPLLSTRRWRIIRIEQGAITALKAGGRWLPGDTLLVAAGTAPDTSFLEGTGLLTDGRACRFTGPADCRSADLRRRGCGRDRRERRGEDQSRTPGPRPSPRGGRRPRISIGSRPCPTGT